MIFNIIFNHAKAFEPETFIMNRDKGHLRYIFFHFSSQIKIVLGGKEIVTNPGAVICFDPNTPQIFVPFNSRLNHDYVDFELVDNDFFKSIRFPMNTIIYPRNNKEITSTIQAISALDTNETFTSKYEKDVLLEKMFIDITKTLSINKKSIPKLYMENIREQFESLRLTLYSKPKEINVSYLAKSTGFSTSYFNKIYKEFFKITPIKDINRARIEYVKSALTNKNEISNLAVEIGFKNEEYFYTWFKKETGMTPSQFILEYNQKKD